MYGIQKEDRKLPAKDKGSGAMNSALSYLDKIKERMLETENDGDE